MGGSKEKLENGMTDCIKGDKREARLREWRAELERRDGARTLPGTETEGS